MSLSPLAVDIETVGKRWESFDEQIRKYLLDRGKKEKTKQEVINQLPLSPATGRIVAVGMWRPEEQQGGVLLEGQKGEQKTNEWKDITGGEKIYRGTEAEILKEFWRYVSGGVGRLITFNGRSFDGPFLMLRSAILGVKPTRSFSPYRYSFKRHCDLAEVVSFFGARRLSSLDFWCRQTGIESPKKDLDGSQIRTAYEKGNLEKIGEYCLQDARATAQLFNLLQPVIESLEREL